MKKPQKPKLQRIPPFSSLSTHGCKYVYQQLRWVELPKDKIILQEGLRGNFLAFVGRGQVDLVSINGETQTLYPGDSLGGGMLRYGVPSSFKAVSKSDVGLWVVRRSDWLIANGLQTEGEATKQLSSKLTRTPLWMKISFVTAILAILILGPLLPEIASAEMKDLARETGRSDLVAEVLHRSLIIDSNSAQIQEALGYSRYLQGENEEAIKAFKEAVAVDPNSATAQNNLGVALTKHSQASQAIRHLLIAVELDPSSADYYFNLGNAYLTNRDFSNAADAYQRAFDLDPFQLEARAMWAGIALENGELDQAESAWEQVLEIRPDHAYSNKGIGFVKVLKGRYGQALSYLEHALEIDSQDDRTIYYLGLALYALESREEAAGQFEKLILVSSDPAVIDLASNQLRLMGP